MRMRVFFILFCLLVFAPVEAQADAPASCDQLAAVYGAEYVPIDNALPHGWDWVVDDMEWVSTVRFGNSGKLSLYRETPARRFWMAHYFDTVPVNGGLHNLCMFRYPFSDELTARAESLEAITNREQVP